MNPSPSSDGGRRDGSPRVALAWAAVIAVCLLAFTPWTTLWDRDETWYARAALEGWRRGHASLPYFRGQPFLEKPPLLFVAMSLSMRAFGVTSLAARCWSPLAVAWTALMIYLLARRAWSHEIGLWAMAFFVLTPMTWVLGQAATTDALLVAGVTTALAGAVFVLMDGASWPWLVAVAVGCAMGTLAKGVVAVVLVIIAIVSAALAIKGHDTRRRLLWVLVVLSCGVLPYIGWFVWADAHTSGALRQRVFVDTWVRSVQPLHGHGGARWLGVPYYVLVVAVGFAPWCAWLGEGVRSVTRHPRRGTAWFLASWGLAPIALFSLAATRLPHYIYPAWPALSVVAAIGACSRRTSSAPVPRLDWLRFSQPLLGGSAGVALLIFGAVIEPMGARVGLLVAGAVSLVGTAWAWRAVRDGEPRVAAVRSLLPTVVVLAVLTGWVAPALEPLKASPVVAGAVRRAVPPDVPVAAAGFVEPGLDFYLDADLEVLAPDQVTAWAARTGPGVLLLTEVTPGRATQLPANVDDLGRVRAFDHTKGREVDVHILARRSR